MHKSVISLIVAMTSTYLIGRDNQLPWDVPEELQYFRKMTANKPVIMGSKTFESIGKPLPNRYNIVLTRHPEEKIEGVHQVTSVEAAIHLAEAHIKATRGTPEIMVIGGAKIYELFLPYAKRIYLSLISGTYRGDTFFPDIDWTEWTLKSEQDFVKFKAQIFER